MKRIRVVDSSDTAGIIWGGEDPTMNVRSNAGKPWLGTSKQSKTIVIHWIESVEKDRDKLSFIERMIAEIYKLC